MCTINKYLVYNDNLYRIMCVCISVCPICVYQTVYTILYVICFAVRILCVRMFYGKNFKG